MRQNTQSVIKKQITQVRLKIVKADRVLTKWEDKLEVLETKLESAEKTIVKNIVVNTYARSASYRINYARQLLRANGIRYFCDGLGKFRWSLKPYSLTNALYIVLSSISKVKKYKRSSNGYGRYYTKAYKGCTVRFIIE